MKVKLYEAPRESVILLEGVKYGFQNIDGMYSICFSEYGEIVYISASSEVELVTKESYSEFVKSVSRNMRR